MNLDFDILWKIGHAIATGADPYAVTYSYYPPAATYFLAIFGALPREAAFVLLTLGNLGAILFMLMRKSFPHRSLAWVLYTPLIYALGVGQLDLLFLGCFYLIDFGGWMAVLAAGLLTLKPQLAFVALPWILFQWLRKDRKLLAAWVAICLILHGFPLLLDHSIYARWFQAIGSVASGYNDTSPGLFSLAHLGIPLWVLLMVAGILMAAGVWLGKVESLVAQCIAQPFGYWYNLVLLVGNTPWKLMVPVSWLSFFLSYFVLHAFFPMLLIPLSAAIWLVAKRRSQGTSLSALETGAR